MSLSLDDFEWVESGFDMWILKHKTKDATIAHIRYFNGAGWHVLVAGELNHTDNVHAQNLDSAKAIAAIHASKRMEDYGKTIITISHRVARPRPNKIPKGVFKME